MIRRSTWILLALFAISLGGLWFWQQSGGKSPGSSETPSPTAPPLLLSIDPTQLREIKVEDAAGQRLVLSSLGGANWIIMEPVRDNVDMETFASTLQQLSMLQPLSSVDPIPPLDQIGMVIPAYRITITDHDGQETVLDVGTKTPTQSGYYVRVDGKLYVVGASTIDSFVGMLSNPPVAPKTVTPTELSSSGTITTTLTTPPEITGTVTP